MKVLICITLLLIGSCMVYGFGEKSTVQWDDPKEREPLNIGIGDIVAFPVTPGSGEHSVKVMKGPKGVMFDSGDLSTYKDGTNFTYNFGTAGRYQLGCIYHRHQTIVINVVDPEAPPTVEPSNEVFPGDTTGDEEDNGSNVGAISGKGGEVSGDGNGNGLGGDGATEGKASSEHSSSNSKFNMNIGLLLLALCAVFFF
ncbi:hypothetical protein CYY_008881 [Polysphondylium violaceum]|uniref:Blue (type 1) copper domain-containing protein n=1 Tax=Polysphondylium violaceum TaxID=133409 RepID=A0A8J4PPS2_9MYCE|nr:hypothetical protein CYY_008881 [Polysphondylium violaceum]